MMGSETFWSAGVSLAPTARTCFLAPRVQGCQAIFLVLAKIGGTLGIAGQCISHHVDYARYRCRAGKVRRGLEECQ